MSIYTFGFDYSSTITINNSYFVDNVAEISLEELTIDATMPTYTLTPIVEDYVIEVSY